MKKIYVLTLSLFSLWHFASSQTGVFDAATGSYVKNTDHVTEHTNAVYSTTSSVDIDCGAGGKFWTVNETSGAILEWQISGGAITFLDTLFATSPVYSLAYCNLFNPGSIATTLYGSHYETVFYYNGATWDSVVTSTYFPNVGGCGRFLYYMDLDNDLVRYDGTTFKTIFTLSGAGFSLFDIAVDSSGTAWPLISKTSTTDSLIAIDSAGNVIRHYSLAHIIDPTNSYGCFMMDSTLYIGFGNGNGMYPNTVMPIKITADTAIIGAPMPFVNGNFADMASCSNVLAAPPVADFTSAETAICANGCINFTNTSANATSWQWRFAGATDSTSAVENPQSVCYETAGAYNVTLIASNSIGSDTVTFSNYINVYAAPPTPIITQHSDTLYCSTDTSYASYQWLNDTALIAGATDTFLVVSQSGNYNVQVTNANNCKIAVGINIILGIQNYMNDNNINLYPNPATNQLTIHISSFHVNGTVTVSIMNVLSQETSSQSLTPALTKGEGDAMIDVSKLSSGIYFVQVVGENERWMEKFVKE